MAEHPYLHSNLVIFKLLNKFVSLERVLNLHSNLVIFKLIRLWLRMGAISKFTFQSGDIQISSFTDSALSINIFTFQSGDIQIGYITK